MRAIFSMFFCFMGFNVPILQAKIERPNLENLPHSQSIQELLEGNDNQDGFLEEEEAVERFLANLEPPLSINDLDSDGLGEQLLLPEQGENGRQVFLTDVVWEWLSPEEQLEYLAQLKSQVEQSESPSGWCTIL